MTNSKQDNRVNKDGKLTLTFCGGVGSVTGANFLLTGPDGVSVLVDCGLEQGTHDSDLHNILSGLFAKITASRQF